MPKTESVPLMQTPYQTLALLSRAGLKIQSFIDCGAATGHFSTEIILADFFPDAVFFNVEPNKRYQDLLKSIAETSGGGYECVALSDSPGTARMTLAADDDWASLRPASDEYWGRFDNVARSTEEVKVSTIDLLVETRALAAPYGLRIDIQGSELAALRGAAKTLERTAFVIVETDIADFAGIDAHLRANGLELFDLTNFGYNYYGRLLEFYPVYVHHNIAVQLDTKWVSDGKQAELTRALRNRRDELSDLVKLNIEKIRDSRRKPGTSSAR